MHFTNELNQFRVQHQPYETFLQGILYNIVHVKRLSKKTESRPHFFMLLHRVRYTCYHCPHCTCVDQEDQ